MFQSIQQKVSLGSLFKSRFLISFVAFTIFGFFAAASVVTGIHLIKNQISLELSSREKQHDAYHRTGDKILEREIADLNSQLEQSLGKDNLQGEFEIHPGKNGLRATHSAVPYNPIEIESLAGSAPFANILKVDPSVEFSVFNNQAYILTFSNYFEHEGFHQALANWIRTSSAQIKKSQEKNIQTTLWYEASELKQALPKPIKPDWKSWLKGKSFYKYRVSSIPGSNLFLISQSRYPSLRGAVIKAIAPIALLGAFFVGVVFLYFVVFMKNRKSSLAWVRDYLVRVRYGRSDEEDASTTPIYFNPFEAEVIQEVKQQLCLKGTYSSLHWGKWVDQTRKLASWNHFVDQLAIWSLKQDMQSLEVGFGKQWFLAKVVVSKESVLEQVIKYFSKSFVERGHLFYQYNQNELWILGRAHTFNEWVEKVHKATRAVIHVENLGIGDIRFSGIFMDSLARHQPKDILQRFENMSTTQLKAHVSHPVMQFFETENLNEAVVQLNWNQTLSLSIDAIEEFLYFNRIGGALLEIAKSHQGELSVGHRSHRIAQQAPSKVATASGDFLAASAARFQINQKQPVKRPPPPARFSQLRRPS